MIAQQQVRHGPSVAATLALAAALTVGGVAGYALRGLALTGDPASLKPTPHIQWTPYSPSDESGNTTPRADVDDPDNGGTRPLP